MQNIMKKKKYKKIKEDLTFNIVVSALMLIFALICLLPLVNILSTSFSHFSQIINLFPKQLTLYSYKMVIQDVAFFRAFGMSVFITVTSVILSVCVILLAAFACSKTTLPGRRGIMFFFVFSMLFSGGLIPTYVVMEMSGLINSWLVLILPGLAQVYNFILMKNYFEGLPQELEEAAKIDGAGYGTVLFKIFMPASVPMVATISLFMAVGTWNSYYSALIYLPDKDKAEILQPLALYIMNLIKAPQGFDILVDPERAMSIQNIQSATIILSLIPILCIYPFILKHFTKGVVVGSVKG